MKALARFAAATLVLGLVAQPAAAQLVNNPTYFGPKPETGLSIFGDYGKGLNTNSGKGHNIGVRAELSMPMIMVGIGAGSFKASSASASSITQFEGEAALTLMSLPLTGVSVGLHAGAGYWSNSGAKQMTVPIGLTLGVKPPTPGMSIEPWISPRIQITHSDNGVTAATNNTNAGVSAGVNLGIPGGLGLHAAVDYLNVKNGGVDASPLVFGVGLHYSFTLPGMGMVPGM